MSVGLSIIIPVYNSPDHLRECLTAAVAQAGPDTEILVVDDASTDDTAAVAARSGARVIRLPRNSGPAAARNHGAGQARGDVLFFIDADVVIRPGAVAKVRQVFAGQPDVTAIFGSYDDRPRAAGAISRYRNLLHHFVHQNGPLQASTFWAGCGAIRRAAFQELGGFDAQRFRSPSIEDIELGHRLRRVGHTILFEKSLQGTHLKHWGLLSMIRTDVTRRAVPWARLTFATGTIPNALNLAWDQRLSAVLVALALVFGALAAVRVELAAVAALALGAVLAINGALYRFFFRRGGLAFALGAIALHCLYFVYSGLSYLFVWLEDRLPRAFARRPAPSTVAGPRSPRTRR